MEKKNFIFTKPYLLVKTKVDIEIYCKEGRTAKLSVVDTENGDWFIFTRHDFLYAHSDTTLTMCHLTFKGDSLEDLEYEEYQFLPNFTTRAEFIEHKQKNIEYAKQNEKDKEEIKDGITKHLEEFEEHKKSNTEDFEKNEEEHTEIKNLIEKSNYEEIAWSDLKQLRDSNKLISGKWYCITDYTCVTNSAITTIKSDDHPFYILVLATSNNTLSETAFAKTMPQYLITTAEQQAKMTADAERINYFLNSKCNLDAWELKYCLDNDQARFPWCGSDADGGRGVIWWMKDEFGNECYYDFKNIMEKRYEITDGLKKTFKSPQYTALTEKEGLTIDTENPLYFYTFSIQYGTAQSDIKDLSVELGSVRNNNYNFSNNKFLDSSYINSNTPDNFKINTVIIGRDDYKTEITDLLNLNIYNNKLFSNCYSNTFNCYYNGSSIITPAFYNNIFYGNCYNNNFYNNTLNNTLMNNCCSNEIYGSNNYFENGCYDNTISGDYNYFGKYCLVNNITGDYNRFGIMCQNNTVGRNCNFNTFGSSCKNNILENNCRSIIFEGINIGNIIRSIDAGCSYIKFNIGVNYLTLNCDSILQNVEIHTSNGTSSSLASITLTGGLAYKQNVFVNSSGTLTSNTVGY